MNPFALAYREQQQLFIYDKTYLAGTFFKLGGLSTLIARFIVQFFWNPGTAMALTIGLLILSSYMSWAIIRKDRREWQSILLSLVPSCLIGVSLSDNNLHFDFLISILLVEAGLIIFKNIRKRRIPAGIILSIFLYFSAGPASIIFATGAALMEMRKSRSLKTAALSFPVITLLCGIISYYAAFTPTLACALTPSFHYGSASVASAADWASWLAVPAIILLGAIRNSKIKLAAGTILLAASLAYNITTAQKTDKAAVTTIYEYEYYTVNNDWEGLSRSCKSHIWSPGTANYMNLAHAYKGTLSDNLLKYDNRGISSLLFIPEAKTVDVRMAHIMFAMGNMAAAQNVAFNALSGEEGYSPAMVKMNAQIELMRGSYKVAEKYLTLLEKSLHYRNWAKSHKAYLWNDTSIEQDELLSRGRKDLNVSDGFAMHENPVDELMKVVEANPGDKKAMDYAISFLLLSKDINRLKDFVDRYWGAEALTEMPKAAQEALIFYSEYSRNFDNVEPVEVEWCTSHGVTQNTIQHFESFKNASLRNNGSAPSGYNDTYWNYLLYKQL